MNADNLKIFRFIGDFLSISSRIALIRKIRNTNSLSGLSLKTNILYLLVYLFRYSNSTMKDFGSKMWFYNTTMKIVYISFQIYIISLFYGRLKSSYSKKYDTFNIGIFIIISFILSVLFKDQTYTVISYIKELLYTCSLILESLAILPQLSTIQDSGECEKLTAISISLLGLYRLNYLIFFTLKIIIKKAAVDNLIVFTSLIQSILYLDFYRIYYNRIK